VLAPVTQATLISEHQYRHLKETFKEGGGIGCAAMKAGMDRKTARAYATGRAHRDNRSTGRRARTYLPRTGRKSSAG